MRYILQASFTYASKYFEIDILGETWTHSVATLALNVAILLPELPE